MAAADNARASRELAKARVCQRLCPGADARKLKSVMKKVAKTARAARAAPAQSFVQTAYVCPECGNHEQEHFVVDYGEGDVICAGWDGDGCGVVVSERLVHTGDEFRTIEGEDDKNHHGSVPAAHLSSTFQLATRMSAAVGTGSRKISRKQRHMHQEIAQNFSNYGKDSRKTRQWYKDDQIRTASFCFQNEVENLAMNPRIQELALGYFAPYRQAVEQMRNVHEVYAACLVLALEGNADMHWAGMLSGNCTKLEDREAVAARQAPKKQGVKRAPPPATQWVPPPPPPKKKHKHSCLFHASPKRVQTGANPVSKIQARGLGAAPNQTNKENVHAAPARTGQEAPAHERRAKVKELCLPILKTLMEQEWSFLFNEPVDAVALNLPDYFEVVKQPMDLGSVKTNLEGLSYALTDEFVDDVRLTFNNAVRYNKCNKEVHEVVRDMLALFEAECANLARGEEAAACRSSPASDFATIHQ